MYTLLQSQVFGRWRSTFSRGEWNFARIERVRRGLETLLRERFSHPRYTERFLEAAGRRQTDETHEVDGLTASGGRWPVPADIEYGTSRMLGSGYTTEMDTGEYSTVDSCTAKNRRMRQETGGPGRGTWDVHYCNFDWDPGSPGMHIPT